MLGTSLVVGWFLVMKFAAEDQLDQQDGRHDLHVGRRLVDHRLARPLVRSPTPTATVWDLLLINLRGAWSPTAA